MAWAAVRRRGRGIRLRAWLRHIEMVTRWHRCLHIDDLAATLHGLTSGHRVTRLVLLDSAAPRQSMFQAGPIAEPVHPYIFASVTKALEVLLGLIPTATEPDIPGDCAGDRSSSTCRDQRALASSGPGFCTAILAQASSSASTFSPEISLMTRDRGWCTSVTVSR